MDALAKAAVHVADLKALTEVLRRRLRQGLGTGHRFREINSICIFALCFENNENKRLLIGFQRKGQPAAPALIDQLFDPTFAEIDDVDFVLIPDLGPDGHSERELHRIQMVSYVHQRNPNTANLISFLEKKKLAVPRDDDLILVIHVEQQIAFDYVKLSCHLQFRRPKCPYTQIYLFGEVPDTDPKRWMCMQIYPLCLGLNELDQPTVDKLLADRRTRCLKVDSVPSP